MQLMADCLVIGYGNTLRSDDAAGQRVAEIVAEWNLEHVRSLPVHQLTPELAEPLSRAQLAIFIDVYVAIGDVAEVQVIELTPLLSPAPILGIGHTADPRSLLTLAQQLYGAVSPSWWILIPAINFEFGEHLSAVTQAGMEVALEQVKQLLQASKTEDYPSTGKY